MEDKVAVLTQTLQSSDPNIPTWIMIVLVLTFPPAAFYLMRSQKKYHRYFPLLLLVLGGVIFLVFAAILFLVLPKLNSFYVTYSITPMNFPGPVSVIAIFFGLIQFALGAYGQVEINKAEGLARWFLNLSLVFLALDYCLVFLLPILIALSVIFPIYSSTAKLY
jgi:hypothetical protein